MSAINYGIIPTGSDFDRRPNRDGEKATYAHDSQKSASKVSGNAETQKKGRGKGDKGHNSFGAPKSTTGWHTLK